MSAIVCGKKLVFIFGAEGSGTTYLSRLMSSPKECACIGGIYHKFPNHPEATNLVNRFKEANARMWDLSVPGHEQRAARRDWVSILESICQSEYFAPYSTILFKRSFPFGRLFLPDMHDLFEVIDRPTLAIIYRDPRAATVSNFTRKFDSDLVRLARRTNLYLTLLAGQLSSIPRETFWICQYSDLCCRPEASIQEIAEFYRLPHEELRAGLSAEKPIAATDTRWKSKISEEDVRFLDEYFSATRRRQWSILFEATAAEQLFDAKRA